LGGTLYVADTLQNRIAAIPNALLRRGDAQTGITVSQGHALNGPLGLAIAPDGHILTVNSGDGNIVETERDGEQIVVKAIDVSQLGAGTLFGLAIAPGGKGVYFVDDGDNSLDLLH
jgi:DNA-binding beta-propeller fold protein YncE